jgi:carbon-monoxide dehydrogenase medium subunit
MTGLDDEQHGTEYLAPTSIEAALALLAAHGEDAKLVAGGQSLLVFLRQGLLAPRWLIGLKRIPELTVLERTDDGGLTIGAMVTQHRLETDPLVLDAFPALAEAAAAVASPLIRRQGTLGGNLCHADPTGDPPAALIALGAEVEIAGPTERRRIPVEDLFADYMETTLAPDEVLVAVHLSPPRPNAGAAYLKHRIRGVDTALVGAGVGLTLATDGKTCLDARIGVVGAGATPARARDAEAALRGRVLSPEALVDAGQIASEECEPLSDTEGSEWYRRAMIAVFVRRAGETALARARHEEAR